MNSCFVVCCCFLRLWWEQQCQVVFCNSGADNNNTCKTEGGNAVCCHFYNLDILRSFFVLLLYTSTPLHVLHILYLVTIYFADSDYSKFKGHELWHVANQIVLWARSKCWEMLMFDNRHMELRRVSNVITKSYSTVARFQFYLLAVHSSLVGHTQEKSATCLCLSLRYRLHCVFYTGVIMPLS